MNDYKSTLNLPQTHFPMKANLPQREPEILLHWKNIDLYHQLRQKCHGRPRFILHDGPPYANGQPHLGTALNKILKDIVNKSKTLSGYDAPYVPGWDCHGLPIELNVEKKVGKPGQKLTSKQFRQACRDYATKQVALQSEGFQRLGVIGDWDNPYLSMNYQYEANAVRALACIIANGHLHRGQKPVHWCTACHSALAEAEVEYQDKQSPTIDVAFTVIDTQKIADLFGIEVSTQIFVPIWTTTPWTLPANQAVCVHPSLNYTVIHAIWQNQPIQLLIAEDMVESVLQRYGIENYQTSVSKEGQLLEHIQLLHPFLKRNVPILLGEHVTTEIGTGCVHTAPAHGLEDFEVGIHYQLDMINPVDGNSCFTPETFLVAGLNVFNANNVIIEHLKENGKLLHSSVISHSYPHCWRHKTPLIFRATPQWFISMEQNHLREHVLATIPKIEWLPGWGQARMESMINSRSDWCISRQRTWGIPIALCLHKHTQQIHPRTPELMEKVAEHIEKHGIEGWFDLSIEQLLGEEEASHYYKVTDVLDVWFDSGVSHFCVLEQRPELHVPADLYLEGSDQHRGWFQTSLLTSVGMRNIAPYKTVLTHGYVVDGKGFKMSKSLGNVIAPSDVVKKLGADVLRLWAAALDHRNDINVSDEILQRSADTYRRIRNTARFLLANLNDFSPMTDKVPPENMVDLDRWAVILTQTLQKEIIEAYHNFQFPLIYQKIHNFCTVQMGSFYLDIIKDRQYTSKRDGLPRRSAQTALYYIIESLARWLAPILSFTAEEIWQYLPSKNVDSIFLTTWFEDFPTFEESEKVLNYWQAIMQVRDEVNKILEQYRQDGKIGSALEAEVTLYAQEGLFKKLLKLGDELRFVLITSEANIQPFNAAPSDVLATHINELTVAINVAHYPKCVRCWQRRIDVGNNPTHDALCGRCIENLGDIGEQRQFA